MKGMISFDIEGILDASTSLIFTPFQEETIELLSERLAAVHVFDCSNHHLVLKLNQLKEEELFFLFSQVRTSIFSHAERLSSFPRVWKIFQDNSSKLQLIALGQSRSFLSIQAKTAEKEVYAYFSSSFLDMVQRHGIFKAGEFVPKWLVTGMTRDGEKTYKRSHSPWLRKCKSLRINKPQSVEKALIFIANRTHTTFSYRELGFYCGIDNETAERYVRMLCDVGIIFCMEAYSFRKRYEYVKGVRAGFWDNGLLNVYKNNFSEIDFRTDVPDLWKNWLIAEKIKKDQREHKNNTYFFWQSHTHQNIDLLVVSESGEKQAFMVSWRSNRVINPSPLFVKYYVDIPVHAINLTNYITFIT